MSTRTLLLPLALLIAGTGLVTTVDAAEAPSGYSKTYQHCMDTQSSTGGMVDCIASETRLQDQRLNANYQAAIKPLEPKQRTALRDVQRLWMQFRDADCALENGLTGGTIDRVNAQMCLLQATRQRADTLAARLQVQDR